MLEIYNYLLENNLFYFLIAYSIFNELFCYTQYIVNLYIHNSQVTFIIKCIYFCKKDL